MKRLRNHLAANRAYIILAVAATAILAWLMLYRLGTLVGSLSSNEHAMAAVPVGWHAVYHDPLYLPLKAVRSVLYLFAQFPPGPGAFLARLPNALFGALSIVSFTWLIWLWHGRRTALIAGLLFATGAWTLHVSRLASFDVLYLCTLPLILLVNVVLQRHHDKAWAVYGSVIIWGVLLYIPGMIWLVLANLVLQRKSIAKGWRHFDAWWQRLTYVLAGAVWLPLLVYNLAQTAVLRAWLGLPAHLDIGAPLTLLKNFAGVFVHLFIRGPQYPELWLGKAPILDIFTLAMCVLGICFYALHWRSSRSRLLAALFLIGTVLISLGGPVGLSLLVPLLYVLAATGVAYLIKEWLQVFPLNPLARGLGLSLVAIAVILACAYNLRAYFIAWPHNDVTQEVFRYRP